MKGFNGMVWRRVLVATLLCAGLAFIAYLTWKYRSEIASQLASANVALALAAVGTLLLSNLGIALVFSELVNQEMPSRKPEGMVLMGTFLLSQIAKYVPGRVWGAVLQGAAVGPALSIHRLVRINVDLTAMAAVVTMGSALAFLGWIAWGAWVGLLALALTTAATGMIMVQRPSVWLHALLGRFLPRLRMAESPQHGASRASALGGTGVLLFVSGYCVGWLMLSMAVTGVSFEEGLHLTSMLSLSYLAGLLSMLPAGLGVREAFLLASSAWLKMDMASVTLLAIVTRLAMVAVDLLSMPIAGILLLLRRRT